MEALLITQASPDCARATTEGRELARPVQGQSAVLASTPTRPPATIQVRKPVPELRPSLPLSVPLPIHCAV